MNSQQVPPRQTLKAQARQAMAVNMRLCMAASGIFLALQMAALFFEMKSGGVLSYYLLNSADYNTATGIWLAEGGLTAVLRFDAAGVLLALPLSFRQLGVFATTHSVVFIITMPLLMGVLEYYCAILQKQSRPLSSVFRWYVDLRLTAKAVGLGLVLGLVKWGARFVGAAPSLALFVWTSGAGNLDAASVSGLTSLAMLLLIIGEVFSYWVYTLVLPAQYLLICAPDSSLGRALTAGVKIFRGRRRSYFVLRLSFLLWFLIVNVSYGVMGLFVQPYFELSNLLFLHAATASGQAQDLPAQP